jgi:hypothetical protein
MEGNHRDHRGFKGVRGSGSGVGFGFYFGVDMGVGVENE